MHCRYNLQVFFIFFAKYFYVVFNTKRKFWMTLCFWLPYPSKLPSFVGPLGLSLPFMILIIVKNANLSDMVEALQAGFVWCFLLIRLKSHNFGKTTMDVMLYSFQCIISGALCLISEDGNFDNWLICGLPACFTLKRLFSCL